MPPLLRTIFFLLPLLAPAHVALGQAVACEHRGATSVFELAVASPLLATAAVARPSGGAAFLIALEWHRGSAPRGAHLALADDDPSLVDGERVLVFVRRDGAELRAAAGARSVLRGADLGLAPELALYAELPREEREELAVKLARRSPRCAADRAATLAQSARPRAVETPHAPNASSFLLAVRARRARQG